MPDRSPQAKALDIINAGRILADERMPWFQQGLHALRLVLTTEVPRAAVDRQWRVYLNPEWAATQTPRQLEGAWFHELEHVLSRHADRADAIHADQQPWNTAADAAINSRLRTAEVTLPENVVYPESIGCLLEGKAAEFYYATMQQQQASKDAQGSSDEAGDGDANQDGEAGKAGNEAGEGGKAGETGTSQAPGEQSANGEGGAGEGEAESGTGDGPSSDCGSGADGVRRSFELPDNDGIDSVAAEHIIREIAREIRSGKHRGTVPGHWVQWAEDTLAPPLVPWQRIMAAEVRKAVTWVRGNRNYSMSRLSRRSVAIGCPLPGRVSPVARAAMVIDTSGSMSPEELDAIRAELSGLARGLGMPIATVICDAKVHGTHRVTGTLSASKLVGRGGTNMVPGIEEALASVPKPNVVIVATDGETPWPEQEPVGVAMIALLTAGTPRYPMPDWVVRVPIDPRQYARRAA